MEHSIHQNLKMIFMRCYAIYLAKNIFSGNLNLKDIRSVVIFYIDSEDLFIECNYGWMHGGHFFDENSSEDQEKLNYWKNKNTEFYDNAIRNWTIRDKKKADIASKNALHMLVFWTQDEGKYWINSYADAHQMLSNSQYNIVER